MAEGLSNSLVYCIGQDQYSFIWIGTTKGLNIYDGAQMLSLYFDPDDNTSIPGNNISTLYFEGDSVWIGTRMGLCLMSVKTRKCKRIDLAENTDIRILYKEKGTPYMWIGTNTGLIKYCRENDTYQIFNTSNSNISHDVVRAIYKDKDGDFWIGTFDKLNKLIANSTIFTAIDLKQNYLPALKNNLITSILPVDENNDSLLWIGTQTGIVQFNRYSKKMRFFRENNSELINPAIKTIHTTKSGTIWMGTDFGLAEMNTDYKIKVHLHDPFNSNSLVNSIVWDIFEDNSGTIWFGTNNGISILPLTSERFKFFPMTFSHENYTVGYDVRGIIEDSKGDYWLATQFGVVHYNPDKQLFETFNSEQSGEKKLSNNGIKSFHEDKKGRIWMSTNGGLVLWDDSNNKLTKFSADFNSNRGLRSNYVTDIFEPVEGTLLINTFNGLHRAIENNGDFKIEFIGNLGPISAFGNNYLWSYQRSTLYKTNPETFDRKHEFTFNVENEEIDIQSLLISDDIIWLGIKNGLICYHVQSKQFELYKIKSNKEFPLINLLADNHGNIWASSFSAILKFSVDTKNFEIFPVGEEIPINRFEENCALKKKNGDLIFGGYDGFISFSPEKIAKSDFIPSIKFTRLSVLNQEIISNQKYNGRIILKEPVPFIEDLALSYSQRSFTLEFSALHFGYRNGIRYAFKLDGIDPEWNYLSGENGTASYSNLPSGKYTFKVKGTNTDGVWNDKETILKIKILPPFWASPLFIAIYIILFVAIAGAIFYYYSNRIIMQTELKFVRHEKEHSEHIAQIRQQFFTNISHEFKTPLSLIIGPAEKLTQNPSLDKSAREFVRLIENNARRLLWLNNQLFDFWQLENKSLKLRLSEFDVIEFSRNVFTLFSDKAERKKIKYSFHSEIESLTVCMDLRKIETVLFNLLSNAFKFTPETGEICVSVKRCNSISGELPENSFCITVKDSGIGISEEDQEKVFTSFYQAKEALKMERGSGIGLTLANEYVKMHQGQIILKSQLGKGSEFQVILPSESNYLTKEAIIDEKETPNLLLKTGMDQTSINEISNQVENMGKPVILLIEDEKETADFIVLSLKNKYSLITAENGRDAFQKIDRKLPDLVICDILMPIMDGIEFTRKFKANVKTAHIPLILLTGQTENENQLEGLRSGADAYMVKPFEIDLLEIRIENFLKREQQLAEYFKLDSLTKPGEMQIATQDEKMLERIVDCIKGHLSDPDLDINKVCKETGFSHSILYRKIKSLTGQTVNEFIRTVRLRRAEQLLRTKKFTVAEIMDQTGFSNHSYFSKCFRRIYNLSPREFIDKI